jgi:hypothetical protein
MITPAISLQPARLGKSIHIPLSHDYSHGFLPLQHDDGDLTGSTQHLFAKSASHWQLLRQVLRFPLMQEVCVTT